MNKRDLRVDIVDAFQKKTDDEIDKEFSDLIREKLDDKQFWGYVSGWMDADNVCDDMESWETETKRDAIKEIKTRFNLE